MSLTFDFYDNLIGQGKRFNLKRSDVSTRYGKKVVSVLIEC